MKRLFMASLMTLVLFWGAGAQDRLVILHTNDTHSHIDRVRGGSEDGLGGVIERAAYIDSVRSAAGAENVLVVDAGDFDQGTPYHSVLGGDLEPRILNALGVEVVTLGNHEFDEGGADLARRLRSLDATVVLSNYDIELKELREQVRPWTIIEKAGLKIGLVGAMVNVLEMTAVDKAGGLTYHDPVRPVNRYASLLRRKGCRLVIVLSHLGWRKDCEIAPSLRGVDLIVGGHSHTSIDEPERIKAADGREILVVQDGRWGVGVGKIEIPLNKKN